MEELSNFVTTMADECTEDVPAYLAANRPAKFKPDVMLPKLDSEQLTRARASINEVEEESKSEEPSSTEISQLSTSEQTA